MGKQTPCTTKHVEDGIDHLPHAHRAKTTPRFGWWYQWLKPIPHGSDRLGMILFSYPENIILGHPFQTRSKADGSVAKGYKILKSILND